MGLAKISAEQMAVCRRMARRREAERQRVAEVLKQQFGGKRVVAFGSLVDNSRFRHFLVLTKWNEQ